MNAASSPAPIASVVEQNIRSLLRSQEESEVARGVQEKAADALTFFSGTMVFVYVHAAWFLVWMLVNSGVGGLSEFDPFPFGLLTMLVSLEAIFLSTFVLISQNRSSALADSRSDLDLQTNLLTEHEITRVLRITRAIAEHLGLEVDEDESELEEDVTPAGIAGEIERQKADGEPSPS
jgi:uncharacterized membrane protein